MPGRCKGSSSLQEGAKREWGYWGWQCGRTASGVLVVRPGEGPTPPSPSATPFSPCREFEDITSASFHLDMW